MTISDMMNVIELDEARAIIAELVAVKDLKDTWRTVQSDPYYITYAGQLEIEYDRRKPLAWEAARAWLAKQK